MTATLAATTALAAAACSPATPPPAAGAAGQSPATPAACGLPSDRIGRFVTLPGGDFLAGASPRYPEEGPPERRAVGAFAIQVHEVTNDQFAAFVAATGHVTDAERGIDDPRPDRGGGVFQRGVGMAEGQWAIVRGATWKTPEGPGSSIAGKGNDPVVQVSWEDAKAYSAWAGGRLPTETEFEYAASLGLPDPADQRSGAYSADGTFRANTWQGVFPLSDQGGDGFKGRAPIGCFPASRLGLVDMIGNVWEWTASPAGPAQHIIKGGSHLCADNFCGRYRPSARQTQDSDFSTNHIGFRVVKDLE